MHSYSLGGHAKMVGDRVRVTAYANAIQKAVKPGSVVVEIGAGTALFSLLACQAGAKRVYAIEADDMIQVGREIAAANGFGDRITFIREMSTRVQLPERCSVVISDLHGILPWYEMHIPTIVDARRRFLTGDGLLVPQRDILWATIVEAPELFGRLSDPWIQEEWGFNLEAARGRSLNTWIKARVGANQFLAEPKIGAELDFATVSDPQLHTELVWDAVRTGTGSGILAWFDSLLIDDVSFSNSPSAPPLIYGNAFFPWPKEVLMPTGSRVAIKLRAHFIGNDYVWQWETIIFPPAGISEPLAHFKQSTFFSRPFSTETLRKRSPDVVPVLDQEGLIDEFLLASIDGRTSVSRLAVRLAEKFPARFPDTPSAVERVMQCAKRYSRS